MVNVKLKSRTLDAGIFMVWLLELFNHRLTARCASQKKDALFRTTYPNSFITGLPVEKSGRLIPELSAGLCNGTPSACSTVA